MTMIVDRDGFGPTGKMKRREAYFVHPLWPSHRKHRWPAFWWRKYPKKIVEIHRYRLRKRLKRTGG